MDAKDVPEVSFEEHFENVDIQQRYVDSGIDFDNYELHHTYDLEGMLPPIPHLPSRPLSK